MSAELSHDALPTLRAAFEATGSGAWLMRAIIACGLDEANGYRLELQLGDDRMRGERHATEARLLAGEVELADTDWLSLARHRASGLPLVAVAPYGAIFGGLVAPRGGVLRGLADLPGKRIGVVHAHDKNWLLLRAACRLRHDFDPAEVSSCVALGSKSALHDALCGGALDAALLYWHQVPALVAAGACREVCDLAGLLASFPVPRPLVPTSFFVCHEALACSAPALVEGFARSAATAVARLRADAGLWSRVARVPAGSWAGAALRRKWLARVGLPWARQMTDRLQELADLMAPSGAPRHALPAGLLAAGLLSRGE
ncbi:ABC transporter substrate-binding protein [Aromatoleum petrolei]|uniref:ABC transporter substrate-binding protein n=1 Tax=Aromatoleum petrolei TaxID=76116 RepID=A0ABX1MRV9_9RHOO|nr:ABC transporter substrate-binding protein [Aromatoleum petrolei]NMF90713.1 ABC transporter substrate-binding protein [Aromatoleum petrolei]QTQ36466.1 SsuA/THI5-like domain-containing protein [Aromatoleum petrolei]